MQFRSDGRIGFPGGIIDEEINIQGILDGLHRELLEEINITHLRLSYPIVQTSGFFSYLFGRSKVIPMESTHVIRKSACLNIQHPQDYVCSHHVPSKNLVCHFYHQEVSKETFEEIERNHMHARDFPSESLGLFRVILHAKPDEVSAYRLCSSSQRFWSSFNRFPFAGNAKEQLQEWLKQTVAQSSPSVSEEEVSIQPSS
jgi:8-oxo-dGTP pyrophosphatase MutT (NUDIX family)